LSECKDDNIGRISLGTGPILPYNNY